MIFKKFQSLDINKIDFDKMILITEETMNRVCIKRLISKQLKINQSFFNNTIYKNNYLVCYYVTAIFIIFISIYLRML